ncbi:PspC domain-containing protein [Aliikangiella coralliicola]|uniref:PspC domain-containing protein n=1 Tax=Aliikangiella coralliicola TaxID=2592383 RepID=A0A545TW52_9GAMM|nr:PspC domain-containing protein [Aliikangiella coralliicola]TQV81458.1 PspC domain-containing protein [Aliikangiella coralliicola]
MSKYSHYRRYDSGYYDRRSYDSYRERPRARSKIMGVCAGLARQFGWDVTLVRVVAVLCLLTFTVPTFFAYVIAGALFY